MIGLIQMKATEQTTETMPVALKQQQQLQQSVKKSTSRARAATRLLKICGAVEMLRNATA